MPNDSPPGTDNVGTGPRSGTIVEVKFEQSERPYEVLSFASVPRTLELLCLSVGDVPLQITVPGERVGPVVTKVLGVPSIG